MRLSQLLALTAMALVGLCLVDDHYASANPHRHVAIHAAPTVVQQRFGPLGRLRQQTVINGNVAAIQQVRFRPVFRPVVAVRAPFVDVRVGHAAPLIQRELLVQNYQQPAFVQSQLLVDPRFRLQLNRLNTYNYPVNTAANIVYTQPQTIVLAQPPVQQLIVQPPVAPAVDPQYQRAPDPLPQTALPVTQPACAVVQPAPVLAVQQPSYIAAPALGVRVGRYGLALRGC